MSWSAQTKTLKGASGIAAILLLWQLSVYVVDVPPHFYPSPAAVWRAFIEMTEKGILPSYIADSMLRYLLGVLIGTAIGCALALLIASSKLAMRMLGPMIDFLYYMVELAWIPLFVIWFGFGLPTILVAVVYVVIWPVLFNSLSGIRSIQPSLILAARSLGGSRWQVLREVVLPGMLPQAVNGFRVAAGFAFRALIFGELIGAQSGIGYLIFESTTHLQTDRTVLGMICMGLLWLFIDRNYLRPFEKATIDRWGMVVSHDS